MKREEIKSLLADLGLEENKVKEIVDKVLDLNGKEVNEHKAKMKELEEKVKEYDSIVAKNEELTKGLEEAQGFKDKATKYDEILPKYESYQKEEVHRGLVEKAKAQGIATDFIEFALGKIGEGEDVDTALKDFATNNPRMLEKNFVVAPQPQIGGGRTPVDKNSLSDQDYVNQRQKEINGNM